MIKFKAMVVLFSSTIALTSCGAIPSTTSSKMKTPPPVSTNVLSGLPGLDGPVLVVKVDDTSAAHPQIGLANADVVYIEQVEGGLTRLAAIFSNPPALPDTIGPVRSARISDIDLLAQYGRVGFAFSGAQSKMHPVIAAANLENLSADINPPSVYFRDSTRSAPTNLILNPKLLLARAIDEQKRPISIVKSVGWKFGVAPVGGKKILSVSFKWPAARYGATWSVAENRWLLTYRDQPDLDSNGFQLGSPTLILQSVSITNSIYHDKVGGITPLVATVGSGTAFLLRDGKAISIYWNRASADAKTTWTLKDGTNANFAVGQVWIALIDNAPIFTYPAAPESATATSATTT